MATSVCLRTDARFRVTIKIDAFIGEWAIKGLDGLGQGDQFFTIEPRSHLFRLSSCPTLSLGGRSCKVLPRVSSAHDGLPHQKNSAIGDGGVAGLQAQIRSQIRGASQQELEGLTLLVVLDLAGPARQRSSHQS